MYDTGHSSQEKHSRPFPVSYSVLSRQALLSKVLPAYDIGQRIDCQVLSHGLNDSYLVSTAKGHFLLRVYQAPRDLGYSWRSESEILAEKDVC